MSRHLDRPDVLAAATPWEQLLSALREISGELFGVLGAGPSPWWEGLGEQLSRVAGATNQHGRGQRGSSQVPQAS